MERDILEDQDIDMMTLNASYRHELEHADSTHLNQDRDT
jgi:hypothetical protein